MTREEISNSLAIMILDENTSPYTSAIDFYNHWVQNTHEIIDNPDVATWTLGIIQRLLMTDKKLLKNFIYD